MLDRSTKLGWQAVAGCCQTQAEAVRLAQKDGASELGLLLLDALNDGLTDFLDADVVRQLFQYFVVQVDTKQMLFLIGNIELYCHIVGDLITIKYRSDPHLFVVDFALAGAADKTPAPVLLARQGLPQLYVGFAWCVTGIENTGVLSD